MASNTGNEHEGHRARLRNKFIDNGLDSLEPHEALELYLYYAIPRRNTNPLAHRLLNRYKTLGSLCDAPIDELKKEFGLSENTVVLIKLLPQMAGLYLSSTVPRNAIITEEVLRKSFIAMFMGKTNEEVAIVLGDAKGKMIFSDIVSKGSLNSTNIPVRRIVDLAIRHNASTVYMAHNHPSGLAIPSKRDLDSTKLVKDTLAAVGVTLADHYLVADNDCVSLKETVSQEMMFYTFNE